jgi:hypothetical protein
VQGYLRAYRGLWGTGRVRHRRDLCSRRLHSADNGHSWYDDRSTMFNRKQTPCTLVACHESGGSRRALLSTEVSHVAAASGRTYTRISLKILANGQARIRRS